MVTGQLDGLDVADTRPRSGCRHCGQKKSSRKITVQRRHCRGIADQTGEALQTAKVLQCSGIEISALADRVESEEEADLFETSTIHMCRIVFLMTYSNQTG